MGAVMMLLGDMIHNLREMSLEDLKSLRGHLDGTLNHRENIGKIPSEELDELREKLSVLNSLKCKIPCSITVNVQLEFDTYPSDSYEVFLDVEDDPSDLMESVLGENELYCRFRDALGVFERGVRDVADRYDVKEVELLKLLGVSPW